MFEDTKGLLASLYYRSLQGIVDLQIIHEIYLLRNAANMFWKGARIEVQSLVRSEELLHRWNNLGNSNDRIEHGV
jgi:hypothetical protein